MLKSRASTLVIALCLAVTFSQPAAGAAAGPRVYAGQPSAVPPWMGFVFVDLGGGAGQACGGAAISRNVVLTAAHCVQDETTGAYVDPGQIGVVFAQDDPLAALVAGTAHGDPVVEVVLPSNYAPTLAGGSTNDLALLRLRDPASGSISLVPENRYDLWSYRRTAVVVGWGRQDDGDARSTPSRLQAARLPIDPYGNCTDTIPDFDSSIMLCAGDGRHAAPCQGDSGGPLLVFSGHTPYIAGVVNFGQPCQLVGTPSVFANVAGRKLGGFVRYYASKLQASADAGAVTTDTTPPDSIPLQGVKPPIVRARMLSRVVRSGRVKVGVSCMPGPCDVSLSGDVTVGEQRRRISERRYRLPESGVPYELDVALPRAAVTRLRTLVARRKRGSIALTVTGHDPLTGLASLPRYPESTLRAVR